MFNIDFTCPDPDVTASGCFPADCYVPEVGYGATPPLHCPACGMRMRFV